ncbi:Disease resistance protein (CC-NBS-LRR class) family [Rhynchospora pubera]|uniref:Disease resistance protein (CC-NBS-LRR class) family n=1 Tax=Rhynchospora pubera TaxID=906938 RepID=A0AAV8FV71_9POAL|nr:Disease resistance protein (CC-NBS-LRR class) family [Rhynchospora pubera]
MTQTGERRSYCLFGERLTKTRAVITIVGTGGVGKTTLAHMVYKRTKAHFHFDIMLSVSQQFSVIDLLRRMLNKIGHWPKGLEIQKKKKKIEQSLPSDEEEVDNYVGTLKRLLNRKRYLIILDDVWGVDLWNQLKDALPDNNNGSRVLMTSRSIDVAKFADPRMVPYELGFLNDNDSRDLLLKKAQPDDDQLADLDDLPDALSKRCKGLPLALIVVGGILSTKNQSYHDWKRVLDTMDWHEEDIDCMKVLAMSYEDMPYYLKPCFLHLASFPEDYKISAKRLIKMWIAEGFIPQQGRKTMEETAENFVEQLFQRCMIQVSSRCPNGSIKCFGVHDLLRDLAIHEARQENFVTVFQEAEGINHSQRVKRPVRCYGLTLEKDSEYGYTYMPRFYEFRLLRILEIVGINVESEIQLRGLDRLAHLKYLGFKNCNGLNIILECSFGHFKNLETLDLRDTRINDTVRLPWKISSESIGRSTLDLWTIGTLRHVLVDRQHELYFPKWLDLRNLQTIKWVSISDEETLANQLPIFNSMRKLGVCLINRNINCINWRSVSRRLESLPSLISLGIIGWDIPNEIVYPRALPNYQNLQTLYLDGNWANNVTLNARLFPPHLVKLTLVGLTLRDDPMKELGRLMSLKILRVERLTYYKQNMICSAGFPVLETLFLEVFDLPDFNIVLNIVNGVMSKLKYLKTSWHFELEMPPELKHVTVVRT